jgi:hypothetical protein
MEIECAPASTAAHSPSIVTASRSGLGCKHGAGDGMGVGGQGVVCQPECKAGRRTVQHTTQELCHGAQ